MEEGRRYPGKKQEHSSIVSGRIQNPEGFYSEDWDEDKQEEDEWQTPDKFQKISQMVFCNGVLEIHPVGDGVLSSPRVQHQGGGCSALEEWVRDIYMRRRLKLKPNPKS